MSLSNPFLDSPNTLPSSSSQFSIAAPPSSASKLKANDLPPQLAIKKRKSGLVYSRADKRIQCTASTLELLSLGGFWSHVILSLICDGYLRLIYYDRSFIVETKWTPFVERNDRVNLYKVINGLLSLTPQKWGFALFRNPIRNYASASERDGNGSGWTFRNATVVEYIPCVCVLVGPRSCRTVRTVVT
jgi:hypothetical protein